MSGSLKLELAKYKLDFADMQEVRWNKGSTVLADD